MPGEKVSQKDITNIVSGAYYYTIIPGLLGLFTSKKISWINLFRPVTDRLDVLENNIGNYSSAKYFNKSANFTHEIAENTKLEAVDIRQITGVPIVKVGTTVGGEEVMSAREVGSGEDSNNILAYSVRTPTVLYISVSGGACSITLSIRNSIFGTS